jgi:hypothetical protein
MTPTTTPITTTTTTITETAIFQGFVKHSLFSARV